MKLTSHSKEEQIIIKEDDIFGDDKKEQFRVFGLIHQTRHLIQGEIIKRMYPSEVLMNLNDDIDLGKTDKEDFISYRLQDALLPNPRILGIIGLFILKLFFDPMVACCTHIRDSS